MNPVKISDKKTIGSIGGQLAINWDGLVLPLGDRSSFDYDVSPMRHAWRIRILKKSTDNAICWFDLEESIAMQVEVLLESIE